MTDRPRPMFSRQYARVSGRLEDAGLAALRAELLAGLSGHVVEIGVGDGWNLGHYPASVTGVTAVEPEPYLRALAERRAADAPVPVTVVPGRAERLGLPDHGADAAVLCLALCSFDDRRAALAEVRRVVRPGGTLRFLEHTIAPTRGLRTVQRVADATVWPALTGGCHLTTDPAALITAAGFTITASRALRFPDTRISAPSAPHVLGSARL